MMHRSFSPHFAVALAALFLLTEVFTPWEAGAQVTGSGPRPSDGAVRNMRFTAPSNVVGSDKHLSIRATQHGTPAVGKVGADTCLQMNVAPGNTGVQRYIYVDVEEGFLRNATGGVDVTVAWRGVSMPGLEYDSLDRQLPIGGKYKPAPVRDITGASSAWNLASFHLPDPQFYDRLNGPADFRLVAEDPLVIQEIALRKGILPNPGRPTPPATGREAGREAAIRFGAEAFAGGLSRLPGTPRVPGPASETAQGLMMVPVASQAVFLSLALDDAYWHASSGTAELAVDYHASGSHQLFVCYDSTFPFEPYRPASPFALRDLGSGRKRAFFSLERAWFANRQNHGGDLRIATTGPLCLQRVSLRPGEPRGLESGRAVRIVRHLYRRFLRRPPTGREERLYVRALLTGGLTPRDLMRKLACSREFQNRFLHAVRFEKAVNHLARLIVQRRLTFDEQRSLLGMFAERRFDQLVDAFLDSPEIRLQRGEYVVPGLD